MTLYAFILFIHIASAFLLFAGLALQWVAFATLRRTAQTAEMPQWLNLANFGARLYGPAIGLVILSGGYLGGKLKGWDQAWLPASFITLLVVGLIGLLTIVPRLRRVERLVQQNGGAVSQQAQERLQDPVLLASVRLRAALVFGILLLMVSRVDLRPTILILLFALVAGLIAAAFCWKSRSKAASAA
jgi:hypothetical protein